MSHQYFLVFRRSFLSISVILAGIITGILLGIFGSGGSIITMPSLLYLLNVEPKSAIAMSLGIVAVTASLSALQHWRHGNVDLKITLIFGLFGVIGTYVGALVGVITPVIIQLSIFALVMYAAAWKMLKSTAQETSALNNAEPHSNELKYAHIAFHGITVGVLTGIVGVGGGFLIVPALALLSGLSMKRAIGTSLSIVSLKSFAGFAGYAGSVAIDYQLMGVFTAIAVVGSIIGTQMGHRLPADLLKKGFGGFLLLVATYILFKSILS